MACSNISKAFTGNTCKNAMAGIKNLWIGVHEPNTAVVVGIDNVATSATTDAVAVDFWKFDLPVDLGDAVEDVSADPKLGTSFVDLTINGTLLGLRKDYSLELSKIMKGKQLIVAELYTKDDTGDTVYILYGAQNGVDMTGGGSRTGTEAASLQGYELTWTGKERDYAPFVEAVTISGTGDTSKLIIG